MKLRPLSLLAGMTVVAVGAGLLSATAASAAGLTVSPNAAFDTDTAKVLTFTYAPTASGAPFVPGRSVSFTLLGSTPATFTVTTNPGQPDGTSTTTTGTLNATDVGNGLGSDGPADSGTYAVSTNAAAGGGSEDCPSCFTVLKGAELSLNALSPNGVTGGDPITPVTLTGDGFERGTRIDALLPGTSTVDPKIDFNQAPADSIATPMTDESAEGITTRTTLKRRVTVAAGTGTGARDIRVTNRDGRTFTLAKGFFVNGTPLTSTTPTAADNSPTQPVTRVTFTGSGLGTSGTPFLQYTADPGSSTRDALTIKGSVVGTPTATTYVADFDLRNAAPASYLPVVRNPDSSSNTCGCTFTVLQSSTRVTTVTTLDSDTATAGTDKSQAVGSVKSFVVTGTGFARGTRVAVSGTGVTTTSVQFVSDTALKATFSVASGTALGDRDVTVTRTDATTAGATSTCRACYTVTAAAPSPSPSTGTVDTRPATPTVTVSPSTITASQKSTVSGRGTPGATIEIYAYSRPNTQYALVRSGTIASNGTYSFVVGPSGNTRLYAQSTRNGVTVKNPETVVITVRTSINLKVARTGTRTYRFTGSTLPKRKGQLVTVFYENSSGTRTIASRARVTEQGTYNVTRTFGGTGTFVLFTGTGTDNNNAANNSNRVRTTIR